VDCVTLVIPTLNEAEAIGRVIDEAKQAGFTRILVVDGGSTDGTPQIAAEKGATVIGQTGRGKGNAIATALDYVDTPYVVFIDGDYTYPPQEAVKLLAYLRKYDLVLGARRGPMPPLYRAGNWILAKAISILYGVKLSDPLTGMYAARTELLRSSAPAAQGFDVEAEIIARAIERGASVKEVPIQYRRRLGRKKLKPWHGASILLRAVKAAYTANPLAALYLAGALLTAPGLALAAWVAYRFFYQGVPHYNLGLLALGLLTLGLLSLALLPLGPRASAGADRVQVRPASVELLLFVALPSEPRIPGRLRLQVLGELFPVVRILDHEGLEQLVERYLRVGLDDPAHPLELLDRGRLAQAGLYRV